MTLLYIIAFLDRYRSFDLEELEARLAEADHFPLISIDIGAENEITASGYIRINESRIEPNEPVAFFHPYPDYFHLFPFVISNGVPHFRIENSIEELFNLMGIDQDDVPLDDSGSQSFENVTAIFDSFSKRDFNSFNSVYGNIKHFADNSGGGFWELIEPDFILITNGNETIEPIVLQTGDDFMGFHFSQIRSSRMYLKNGEIYRQLSANAEVSGQLTLLGDVTIWLEFISGMYYEAASFTVSSEYIHMLPRIADFREMSNRFSVGNVTEMMTALGVTRQEMETTKRIEFNGVTMIFDFTWVSSSGNRASFTALPTDHERALR